MGGSDDRLTWAEVEDQVDEFVKDDQILTLLVSPPPPYLLGYKAMVGALEVLKLSEHQCDDGDCDNPACFGKPQHQQYLRETITEEIPQLEEAVAALRRKLVEFIYRLNHCECQRCQLKEKKDAAQFN